MDSTPDGDADGRGRNRDCDRSYEYYRAVLVRERDAADVERYAVRLAEKDG